MGSPRNELGSRDDERPQHRVRIAAFDLGATEVTVGQFRRFVKATDYRTEGELDDRGGWNWNQGMRQFVYRPEYPRATWQAENFAPTDDHPVVNVSWNDAAAFCEWLSRKEGRIYRLPTEAEWEYACRAGTTTMYHNGDDPESLVAIANLADATARTKFPEWTTIAAHDGYIMTAPVRRFRPNAFGLFDMQGNVAEWCRDGYDARYYQRSPADDPPGPRRAAMRVIRGGSWNAWPQQCRSAVRYAFVPECRLNHVGFRVARVRSSR
jgi:formylglycine-generating enzyme